MKVTLDLQQLLDEGHVTQDEYQKLSLLAARSTSSLAFNILIGFGVVAVAGATLALVPSAVTAIVLGLLVLIAGVVILRGKPEQWLVLAYICSLVGALMVGGGIVAEAEGSLAGFLTVTALFTAAAILARSSLLAVLATLALSACLGARTGYYHASYFLVIREPLLTIILFTILAIGLYQLSKKLAVDHERIALASSRTSVFLVNFGFWIGSLWGERTVAREIVISSSVFAVLWAVALVATALWAWWRNRRWVLNTVAVFGGIHFYTQWFEHLGASPGTVLIAGCIALGLALGLRHINQIMPAKI